jgi:glutamine amidotransferase
VAAAAPDRPLARSGAARIAIVDYGMGNRRSVLRGLQQVGAKVTLTGDHDEISAADGIVVPGVGAFAAGMDSLRRRGLDGLLVARAGAGQPILGICLGMQLLFAASEEGVPTEGLGLLPGTVTRLRAGRLRVPHIGWNTVRPERPGPLTAGLPPAGRPFYHVHSYVAHPARPEHVAATAEYGERFATIVVASSVMGVQFHPEKSSGDGLALLAAFVDFCAAPVPGAPSASPVAGRR